MWDGAFCMTNKYVILNVIKRHTSTYIIQRGVVYLYDERKCARDSKGDEDMAKVSSDKESNKTETPNVGKLLSKGIERYDKALEKLSKN